MNKSLNFIEQYNNTEKHFEDTKLHDFLVASYHKYPEKIAIKDFKGEISYRGLYESVVNYSKNFDFYGQPIAIETQRNIDTIIKIYSILYSGNYYIPIDPSLPQARKDYILDKVNARVLLKNNDIEELVKTPVDNCLSKKMIKDDQLAYIMFTSGSTGMPKGVVQTHFQISNTIYDLIERLNLDSNDTFLCVSSFSFDLSVFDIFCAASTGGTVILAEDQRNFNEIKNLLENNRVTVWNSVPSIMDYFLRDSQINQSASDNLKVCLLSGDFVSKGLAKRVLHTFNFTRFFSLGGATECSIWSIIYEVDSKNIHNFDYIPYGCPMSNQKIVLLDENYELCPIGQEGQIAIYGKGVSLGYIADEEKTKNTFINHKTLGYTYLTGDIGLFENDRFIKFIGRKDTRLKYNGYRINTDIINKTFFKLFNSESKVLIISYDGIPDKLCLAYSSQLKFDESFIRNKLAEELSLYEVPNVIVHLETFPLNANGKVNTKEIGQIITDKLKNGVNSHDIIENNSELLLFMHQVFNNEKIGYNQSLFELGLDSIKMVKIQLWIKEKYNIDLPLLKIYELDNVNNIENELKLNT